MLLSGAIESVAFSDHDVEIAYFDRAVRPDEKKTESTVNQLDVGALSGINRLPGPYAQRAVPVAR